MGHCGLPKFKLGHHPAAVVGRFDFSGTVPMATSASSPAAARRQCINLLQNGQRQLTMNRATTSKTSKWLSCVIAGFALGYLWIHFDWLSEVWRGLNTAASTGLNIAWWR
jgi:hypothetical protein